MIKVSAGRRAFNIFNILLITILSAVFLFPYLHVLAKALNIASDTALGGIGLWPRKFTLSNLGELLKNINIIYGFRNTIIRVVLATAYGLIIQYMAAYAFTRKGLVGRRWLLLYFTIPMFFSGGLIPTYIIYAKLKITNTLFVYILPFGFSFYNMVVMRTFLRTIPDSLGEAARIDGASEIRILFTIMFPLSLPIIATVALWIAVSHWNDWTTTLYYASVNWKNYTLQYNLMQVLKESERIDALIKQSQESGFEIGDISKLMTPESVRSAQIIVSTLPIIIVYPFIQKYFVKGVMIGSVKE